MADGYLSLPGTSGNYVDTPDHADFDVLGDIDIQVDVAMDDWTPAAVGAPFSKWLVTGTQRSYQLAVVTNGKLRLTWSSTGSGGSTISVDSTVATGFTDGTRHWIRGTLDVDDGSGNRVVKFYTAAPGASPSWTQLGTTITTAGTTSIFSSTALPALGASDTGTSMLTAAKVYRVNLRNGYDGAGTLKCSLDLTAISGSPSTYTDPEGHVWTERGTANFVAATGVTVTLGLATENDSTFALTKSKLYTAGLASESDSTFAPTRRKLYTAGLASEADSTFALTHRKTATLGLASESDSTFLLAKRRVIALDAENDSTFALTHQKIVTVGLASETDSTLPLAQRPIIGLAEENDSAFAVATHDQVILGLATENDSTFALDTEKRLTLGLASESDSVFPVRSQYRKTIGLASEADSVFALTHARRRTVGLASENDSVFGVATVASNFVDLGLASESDSTFAPSRRKFYTLGLASENDSVYALVVPPHRLLGLASENDSTFHPTQRKVRTIGLATESDSTFHPTTRYLKTLGFPSETDSGFSLHYQKGRNLGLASESDSTFHVVFPIKRALALAQELDTGFHFAGIKVSIGLARENDSIFSLGSTSIPRMFFGPTVVRPPVLPRPSKNQTEQMWEHRRHYQGIRAGKNVYLLTDGSVSLDQPWDQSLIRRILFGGHLEPLTPQEVSVLTSAGYGSYIS